jgi:hypothetical protein
VDETRTIVACRTCAVFWSPPDAPACLERDHEHETFEVHGHRTAITFDDGTQIVAVSFDAADPYRRERTPSFGLYLDDRWDPPWPHAHLDWPDFAVPADPAALRVALTTLLERARAGDVVEVGCLGGHGRTGTAVACLAILTGVQPDDAVAWVREHYCDRAVETGAQAAFVAGFSA